MLNYFTDFRSVLPKTHQTGRRFEFVPEKFIPEIFKRFERLDDKEKDEEIDFLIVPILTEEQGF